MYILKIYIYISQIYIGNINKKYKNSKFHKFFKYMNI